MWLVFLCATVLQRSHLCRKTCRHCKKFDRFFVIVARDPQKLEHISGRSAYVPMNVFTTFNVSLSVSAVIRDLTVVLGWYAISISVPRLQILLLPVYVRSCRCCLSTGLLTVTATGFDRFKLPENLFKIKLKISGEFFLPFRMLWPST